MAIIVPIFQLQRRSDTLSVVLHPSGTKLGGSPKKADFLKPFHGICTDGRTFHNFLHLPTPTVCSAKDQRGGLVPRRKASLISPQ